MDIATLRELPDYIEASDIEAYCVEILGESQRESRAQTLQKLKELTDRQWHTLQEPSLVLKQSLESWLRKSWSPASPEFLETCLSIAYTFALSRGLFEAALSQYAGESEWEYREHLAKSPGPFIDPYWSLRGTAVVVGRSTRSLDVMFEKWKRSCPVCGHLFVPWGLWRISRWSCISCPRCAAKLSRPYDAQYFTLLLLCLAIPFVCLFLGMTFRTFAIVGIIAVIVGYLADIRTIRLVAAGRWRGWLLGYDYEKRT